MRCRPGIVTNAKLRRSRICGAPLTRCTASGTRAIMPDKRIPSRGAYSPELYHDHAQERFAPGNKREANRRKAQCQPLRRNINKRCRLLTYRRRVYAVCATCPLRGCAPTQGAPAFRRFDHGSRRNSRSRTQLQAMLPGTWNQAGVTRPILSQSSDSTSRLGRSAEGNDAQSRPGAGCKPARRHRTRSASESALAGRAVNAIIAPAMSVSAPTGSMRLPLRSHRGLLCCSCVALV